MEKIFNFLKKNMAIIALIIVIMIIFQPRKKKTVTENFSSTINLNNNQLDIMNDNCNEKKHIFDDSFKPTCHNPSNDKKWTPNAENCCAVFRGEMCSTETGTNKNWCYLRHDLADIQIKNCINKNWNPNKDDLNKYKSSSQKYGKYTNKNSSYWSYNPCKQEYFDYNTTTNPTNTNQKVKDRIGYCKYNCIREKDSDGNEIGNILYCPDKSGNPNLNHICLNTNVKFKKNHLVNSYLASGKEHLKDIIEMSNGSSKIKNINYEINENFKNMKKKLIPKDSNSNSATNKFMENLKKINYNDIKKTNNNTETFSQTNDCKFNSVQRKILSDIVAAFNKGVENNQTEDFGNMTPEKSKEKAIKILNNYFAKSVQGKLFDEMIGNNKKKCFKTELERMLNLSKDTIKEELIEGFDNGADYDENGRLREHSRGHSGGCYLITALTKAKLLSLGQVYQLRKLMLEAFKVVSNRPFFSFYYDNFGAVADMLVKENRLSEILPNMMKCIDLSKNGQFDLAFKQYFVVCRQAYQICKDMGMDTQDLEDKFEKLDGTIDMLPEPNSLFVENGFREALKSC
jgi:hypothetical protein